MHLIETFAGLFSNCVEKCMAKERPGLVLTVADNLFYLRPYSLNLCCINWDYLALNNETTLWCFT